MVNKKTVSYVVLAAGVIILALALLADPIGIGSSSGIGRDQIIGALVGACVAVAGLMLLLKSR